MCIERYDDPDCPGQKFGYVPIRDDRGTIVGVADTAGNVIEKLFYNSTGLCKAYDSTGTVDVPKMRLDAPAVNLGRSQFIPFGWCGMYRDQFTGLYHTHFREYDPLHGRWLSEDPAGCEAARANSPTD